MSKPRDHPAIWQAPATLRNRMRAAARRAASMARRVRREWRPAPPVQPPAYLARHWERVVRRLLKYGTATIGNKATVCFDGDDGMDMLWRDIQSARRQIWIEIYILEADRVGRRTIEELTKAAQRGVKVVLLIDSLGSASLPQSALRPLQQAGVEIAWFNTLRPWKWPSAMFRRDHRKIFLIDGRVGYCGGMNLSEDYAGSRFGNGRFHDSLVRMEGPCVRDLAAVSAESWRLATGIRRRLPRRKDPVGDTFAQVLASRGTIGRRYIQRALRLTIRNAVNHCYITTPYLIPPARLVRAIKRAADRGVDVRILTAGVCDVPIVHLAAQHVYGSLLRHGVRIYELYHPILHAKTVTIDGVFSTVGSFNLDTWSDKRNLEVNVALIDPHIAAQLQEVFMRNINGPEACEVMLDTWHKRSMWRRILHWAVYQFMRL